MIIVSIQYKTFSHKKPLSSSQISFDVMFVHTLCVVVNLYLGERGEDGFLYSSLSVCFFFVHAFSQQ
jgi:hypothetical protein